MDYVLTVDGGVPWVSGLLTDACEDLPPLVPPPVRDGYVRMCEASRSWMLANVPPDVPRPLLYEIDGHKLNRVLGEKAAHLSCDVGVWRFSATDADVSGNPMFAPGFDRNPSELADAGVSHAISEGTRNGRIPGHSYLVTDVPYRFGLDVLLPLGFVESADIEPGEWCMLFEFKQRPGFGAAWSDHVIAFFATPAADLVLVVKGEPQDGNAFTETRFNLGAIEEGKWSAIELDVVFSPVAGSVAVTRDRVRQVREGIPTRFASSKDAGIRGPYFGLYTGRLFGPDDQAGPFHVEMTNIFLDCKKARG